MEHWITHLQEIPILFVAVSITRIEEIQMPCLDIFNKCEVEIPLLRSRKTFKIRKPVQQIVTLHAATLPYPYDGNTSISRNTAITYISGTDPFTDEYERVKRLSLQV